MKEWNRDDTPQLTRQYRVAVYIVLFYEPRHPTGNRLPLASERSRGSVRHPFVEPRRRRWHHRVGPDPLHNSSRRGGTFFDSHRRVRRSQQLPAAIPPPEELAPRREKKAYVSVQSGGQVGPFRAGDCGNRIFSTGDVRLWHSRCHQGNFVLELPVAPTAAWCSTARIHWIRVECARGTR